MSVQRLQRPLPESLTRLRRELARWDIELVIRARGRFMGTQEIEDIEDALAAYDREAPGDER